MSTVTRVRAGTVALLVLLSAGCSGDVSGVSVPADAQSLSLEDVYSVRAHWTGYEDPVRMLITDDEAWAEAWATLHESLSPMPERPEVDFDAGVLVLAAMGTRPSTGYYVSVDEVQQHEGVLYVSVVEHSPGPSCISGAALTAPAYVVQVPGAAADARFIVSAESYSC